MNVHLWKSAVRGLVVLGLLAGLSSRGFAQSPNDRGGVGAEGLIGRGTIAEERPAAGPSPAVAYTPVYVAAPIIAPSPPVLPATSPPRIIAPAAPDLTPAVVERPAAQAPVRAPAVVRYNPYTPFHRGWVHGYWIAHPSTSPAWRGRDETSYASASPRGAGDVANARRASGMAGAAVPQPGMGLGWGLPAWLIGPMVYRLGFFPYANPYLSGKGSRVRGMPAALDYSRPVDVMLPPPAGRQLQEALLAFVAARKAFRREAYIEALEQTDEALRHMPEDPAIQEFRGVTLVALHRYREAAEVLYSVVSVVPGWDWTTMAHLYDNPETYTRQLRLLESYSRENPDSSAAHFLLGLEYLTTGYSDDAASQFDEVAALQPGDALVAQLRRELRPSSSPGRSPDVAPGGEAGDLVGTWTARPRQAASITLNIRPDGHLTWKVEERGQVHEYEGFGALFDGVLTLTQDRDNSLTGRITWKDRRHFQLRLPEARPGDSVLSFAKSS